MKKFLLFLLSFLSLFAVVLAIPSTPIEVSADTGPKPTMQIAIKNLEQSDYIVGFGMKSEHYGPHSAFTPGKETHYGNVDDLILLYNNATLPDSWYLSDISCAFNNTTNFVVKSGYMWPSDFILIILNKINSKAILSQETTTYAFHSYFTFDMNNYDGNAITLDQAIVLEKDYPYWKEILEFFLRLFITLAVELLLAIVFKFTKKSLIIIAITNAVTQIGLNVALNISAYFSGKDPLTILSYAVIEVGIVLVEAIIYSIFCKRENERTKLPTISYAIAANVLSFAVGMLLWIVIK